MNGDEYYIDINSMDYYRRDNNNLENDNHKNNNSDMNNTNMGNDFNSQNSQNNNLNNINNNNNSQNNIFPVIEENRNNNINLFCQSCKCITRLIKCKICLGLFKSDFYSITHQSLCNTLNQVYLEQNEMISCPECLLLVKFSEYSDHIKKSCSNTNFMNQKISCQHCTNIFSLDVIEEHESACAHTQTAMLLVSECVDCSICGEKVALLQIESHEIECSKMEINKENVEKMSQNNLVLPKFWENIENNFNAKNIGPNVFSVIVENNSEEFNVVKNLITSTSVFNYEIVNIFRIQNLNLHEKYQMEKNRINIEKDFAIEKMLFFGNKVIKPEHICVNGFDISFALDNSSHGRGIYFQRRSDKVIPDAYKSKNQNNCFIFLANVFVGISHVHVMGDFRMRKPPFYDKEKLIYFDSVTNVENFNDALDADQMFVVYNNEKAYPLYMIELSEVKSKRNKKKFKINN